MTIMALWILFGILNFLIMVAADKIDCERARHGIYWIRGREKLTLFISIIGGFVNLPFTLMALYELAFSKPNPI